MTRAVAGQLVKPMMTMTLMRLGPTIVDKDRQYQSGRDEEEVRGAHEECIAASPVIARDDADQGADTHRDERGEEADDQRDAGAIRHQSEDIAGDLVGSEGVSP